MFLVDTYDTIRSGIPNAIKVLDDLRAKGYEPVGIRLDSGDLAYLSKKAREMLDDAGYENAKIFVSGDLDERVIYDLRTQGACIDVYGVGTKLITSSDQPALGGVYKMSCEIVDGVEIPKMKLSDNPAKTTLPGKKKVLRLYNKSHKAIADLIALDSEKIESGKELKLFHPEQTYKSMTVRDFTVRDLLVPLFIDGKQVYELPTLTEIQEYARSEMDTLWPESKRLLNPHEYKVDISDRLYDLRKRLTWELANQNRT